MKAKTKQIVLLYNPCGSRLKQSWGQSEIETISFKMKINCYIQKQEKSYQYHYFS